MSKEKRCKWLSDDFSEICCNAVCPLCADFCKVAGVPEICRYEELENEEDKNE